MKPATTVNSNAGIKELTRHKHPYEILTILYMIHAIDYNEIAALNDEDEIDLNLLRILENLDGRQRGNLPMLKSVLQSSRTTDYHSGK